MKMRDAVNRRDDRKYDAPETISTIDCGLLQGGGKWCGIAAYADKVYCAPWNADSVLVVDPSNTEVTRTIDSGVRGHGKWCGIVACAGKLYCAPCNADSILVIDPANGDATRAIDCGVRGIGKWCGIAQCKGKLYCAPYNSDSILVINPSNADAAYAVDCGVRGIGKWCGIAECAGKLYCAPCNANSVLVIDPSNADGTSTIDCGGGVRGQAKWNGIAACDDKLYCAPRNARSILVIDPSKNADVTRTIECDVGGEMKWWGIASCSGKLYCAPYNADSILAIDPANADSTRTIDCDVRGVWRWIGVAECAGKLYCAPYNTGSILVIEPPAREQEEGTTTVADSKKIIQGRRADRAQQHNTSPPTCMMALRRAAERIKAARLANGERGGTDRDDDLLDPVRTVLARIRSACSDPDMTFPVEYVSLDTFEMLRRKACVERGKLDVAQESVRRALSPPDQGGVDIELLVEQRNEARDAYVQALIALQDAHSSSDLGRERITLEREVQLLETSLASLETIRRDFQAPPVLQTELPSCESASTPALRALRAFEHWEHETDPRVVTEATDDAFADAWRKLCGVGETQGTKEACGAWELAHCTALEAVNRELKHWSSRPHPFVLLPVDEIRIAVVARLDACKCNLQDLSRARERTREARRMVDEIATARSSAALKDKPWHEAKERLKFAKKTLRRSQRELEDAGDEDEGRSINIELLKENFRVARRDHNRAQRATEDELIKLVELVRDHFPELRLDLKDALMTIVTLSPALRSVVRQGRSPQDYERIPWPDHSEPLDSRHVVIACRYDGKECVLKQFHLRGASARQALEREVETLMSLTHPNIVKVEGVFFVENTRFGDAEAFLQCPLYAGGTLRQWLARPENTIDEGDIEVAVSQWGTLHFLNAEHRHVATTHVRALRQLLAALSYVHAKGVVHGDVKLDNALVDTAGGTWSVVLSDFDMSRTALDGGSIAITTRVGGGTPGYIAPEVRAGARSTVASDIFSFGICVAIALAFDDDTAQRVLNDQADLACQTAKRRRDDALATVLCACLAAADERPRASALEVSPLLVASERILDDRALPVKTPLRTCIVCNDDVGVGVECMNGHFVCDECLAGHVRANTDTENLGTFEPRAGRIQCVGAGCGDLDTLERCGGRIQCVGMSCHDCYTDTAVASHVPQHVFAAYFTAKQRLAERQIAADLERGFDRRIQAEARRIAALSDAERRARETRAHVIERILTLACPRCGAAFAEVLDGTQGFDGCFALTCHRADCACCFCAYCLADCGTDAHQHVQTCAHGQGLFPSRPRETFERAQRARRDRDLRSFLLTLADDDGVRVDLIAGLKRELRDFGLDPQAYVPGAALPK